MSEAEPKEITEQELRELEECEKKASPQPWAWDSVAGTIYQPGGEYVAECSWDPDAIFIIHARQAVPALIAEVRKARASERRMPVPIEAGEAPACPYCTGKIGAHRIVRPAGTRWQIVCPECQARGPMELSAREAVRCFMAAHGEEGDTP